MFEKKPTKQLPDRPLECGECKKTIAVKYTEIIDGMITHTSMCADCPELQKRLYGTSTEDILFAQTGATTGLECGNCGTTLESVKRGHFLGCAECYSVFENVLISEMQAANALPEQFFSNTNNLPFHIGRAPGETLAINASSRLLALNEALKETLTREDYEQAAWLRDQIKALTTQESPNEEGEKPSHE